MSSNHFLASPLRVAKRHRRAVAWITPLAVLALGAGVVLPTISSGAAQAAVGLGGASTFAVLAGAGITNTGATTINGDVGSLPTPSETGFGTVILNGANNHGNAVTAQAKTDLTTGYNTAAGATPFATHAVELGGSTLTPGVYRSGTFGITGTLTLDTQGDPSAVFIFQAGSTFITASNSNVVVLGGSTACNVFWQVGSSATLGTNSHLIGSVLALSAITADTGATVVGRLLARNAAVTLDNNTITTPVCRGRHDDHRRPGRHIGSGNHSDHIRLGDHSDHRALECRTGRHDDHHPDAGITGNAGNAGHTGPSRNAGIARIAVRAGTPPHLVAPGPRRRATPML